MKTLAILLMLLTIVMIVGFGLFFLLGFAMSFDAPGSTTDPKAWGMRLLIASPLLIFLVCLILAWKAYAGGYYGKSVLLGFGPSEGRGLGGQPGRWREFYPQKSPGDYGFVENVGVLCWEDGDGRAHAAEAGLLSAALGPTWRERIRSLLVARTADGADRC